jgi:hypothetical protein
MAAKQTDEGMPIAAIRVYVKKHFPNATAEYMQDAARWVVMGSQGKSYLRDVIGTGPTELKAWRGAYKTAQETQSTADLPIPGLRPVPQVKEAPLPFSTDSRRFRED